MRSLPRPTILLALLVIAVPAFAINVTGTVRDASSNTVLGGMIVSAYDESGLLQASAETDATGGYLLQVGSGRYRFLAYDNLGRYATTFGNGSESFETSPVVQLTSALTIDFKLVPAAFISGYVSSPTGSRSGLTVAAYNLSGTRRTFTKTRADGFFHLVVPPGEYKVAVYDESVNYATVFHRDARAFAEARVVAVPVRDAAVSIDLMTDRVARLNGRATDEATSLPLPSMIVYAFTPEGALVAKSGTDSQGNYRLVVPAGAYRIVAADPALVYANAFHGGGRSFEDATVVNVASSETRNSLSVSMTRGGSVAGRVTDAAGTPLVGVMVAAYNEDGTQQASTETDAEGRYALAVRPGEVVIGASDPTLEHATQFHSGSSTFRFAREVGVAVGEAHEGIVFALVEGGLFTGTVTGTNGQPVAGITVAAYDEAEALVASARTRADGTYAFVVPPGSYRLAAFDASFRYAASFAGGAASYEASMPVTIAADAASTQSFAVVSGIRINGTVASRDGAPLDGIEITALDAAGNNVGGAFSKDGAFSVAVPPGSFRFVAEDVARQYRLVYYPDASRLVDAEVVVVSGGQVPPALQFVLDDAVARRRAARH